MKTLTDIYQLIATAVESDAQLNKLRKDYPESTVMRGKWFINYSGHVNLLSIRYYPTGWSEDACCEKCDVDLTDDGIQEAYWFIKNRLA